MRLLFLPSYRPDSRHDALRPFIAAERALGTPFLEIQALLCLIFLPTPWSGVGVCIKCNSWYCFAGGPSKKYLYRAWRIISTEKFSFD